MNISDKVKKIKLLQSFLDEQLNALQDQCPHDNVEKKYGSNTGNYDPSADCYWIDFYCPDCEYRWREDQ